MTVHKLILTPGDELYASVQACPPVEPPPPVDPPDDPPPPPGDYCKQFNNSVRLENFWAGYGGDSVNNFRTNADGSGSMTNNANSMRFVTNPKKSVRWKFDLKLDSSWLAETGLHGQHLGSLWAPYGDLMIKKDWVRRNLRVDLSQQRTDGLDVVLHAYKNDEGTEDAKLVVDTRINCRVPGAFVAGQWRTVIVTAHYDPNAGRISGTVEYVGKGTKSFEVTDADIRGFDVNWRIAGFGNVDSRSPFGAHFRAVTAEGL